MGEALARDMLGRFGYGATTGDIRRVAQQSVRAYIDEGIRGRSVLPVNSLVPEMKPSAWCIATIIAP